MLQSWRCTQGVGWRYATAYPVDLRRFGRLGRDGHVAICVRRAREDRRSGGGDARVRVAHEPCSDPTMECTLVLDTAHRLEETDLVGLVLEDDERVARSVIGLIVELFSRETTVLAFQRRGGFKTRG